MTQNSCELKLSAYQGHGVPASMGTMVAKIEWLPDEYFVSLIARAHVLLGHSREEDTFESLFGKPGDRQEKDAVDAFIGRVGSQLGNRLEILRAHTVYRLLHALQTERQRLADANKVPNALKQLKYPLFVFNSGDAARHLRACPTCMREDERLYGIAYWHLAHQYPGVMVCLEHDLTLQKLAVTPRGQRFYFPLPKVEQLAPVSSSMTTYDKAELRRLATMIQNLATDPDRTFAALGDLRARFTRFLAEQNMLNAVGRIDRGESVETLVDGFVKCIAPVKKFDEYKRAGSGGWHAISLFITGKMRVDVMDYIALMYWFRTLPFWSDADEWEWFSSPASDVLHAKPEKRNVSKFIPGAHPEKWRNPVKHGTARVTLPSLGWLPDEYFVSLVARVHHMLGNVREQDTFTTLFGKKTERLRSLGNDAVDLFIQRTGGRLGGHLEILEDHTLHRVYQVFMCETEQRRFVSRAPNIIEQLANPLRVYGSGQFAHDLKACPECIKEDGARFGTAYWHLAHQYPGTLVCLKHDEILRRQIVSVPRETQFFFPLPKTDDLAPITSIVTQQDKGLLRTLATLIHNFAADPERSLKAVADFRLLFNSYLSERGMLNSVGRIRNGVAVKELFESYTKAIEPMTKFDEYREVERNARNTVAYFVKGKVRIDVVDYIALFYWFRTLPFWTEADEGEWLE